MIFSQRLFVLSAIIFVAFLSSCNKEGGPGSKPPAVFDSTEKANPVTVSEKEHRIFVRPKVGDVYRYRISQHSNSSAISAGAVSGSESAQSEDSYYLTQTVRAIRADSSVDMSYRFDTISVKSEKDTAKINLSSSRPADRKDPRFSTYAALLGEDIGVIISPYGDIKEMYGTSNIISSIMKRYPDSLRTAENTSAVKQQIEATIGQYIHETMMHFPHHPLAKDSVDRAEFQQNSPIWGNVIYPMVISIKQTLTGFEERGGKVQAVFMTNTEFKPMQSVIENGPVKATLNNYIASTKEELRVDDTNGELIYRKVNDDQSFTLILDSKDQQGKGLTTERKSKVTRIVELLR
ncbi:MAG: DUF6263 family protein [bacterium]